MTLQAFIDESYDESGLFVMAGCISTAEAWAQFSVEWEKMLPSWGLLDEHRIYHFHFQEMTTPNRINNIGVFFDTLYRYSLGFISIKINTNDLKRARSRIFVPNMKIDWAYAADPYFFTFRALMGIFQQHRSAFEDYFLEEKIDFIFDNHVDKNILISSWGEYLNNRPEEIKKYFGATPRFLDDKECFPLQGADLIAGLVRRGYQEGKTADAIAELNIPGIKRTIKKETIRITIELSEDDIATNLKQALRYVIGPSHVIYDVKLSPYQPSL
jgi:hypothetical protein